MTHNLNAFTSASLSHIPRIYLYSFGESLTLAHVRARNPIYAAYVQHITQLCITHAQTCTRLCTRSACVRSVLGIWHTNNMMRFLSYTLPTAAAELDDGVLAWLLLLLLFVLCCETNTVCCRWLSRGTLVMFMMRMCTGMSHTCAQTHPQTL